jgi:hypothetical protein
VLTRALLDWSEGTARIHFQTNNAYTSVDTEVAIVARIVKEFIWHRRQPWGPSEYVNAVRHGRNSEDGQTLDIEMQTGDTIYVEASEISVGV